MDSMDKTARGIGAVGPLVKVTWNDAAEQIKIHTINVENPAGWNWNSLAIISYPSAVLEPT